MEGLFTKSINRFVASVLTAAMLFSFADVPILAYAEGEEGSGDEVYEDTAPLPEFPTEPEEPDEIEPPEEQEEDPADIPEDDYPDTISKDIDGEPAILPIYVIDEDEVRQYFNNLSDAYNALSVDNVIHIIGDYTGDSETLGGGINNIVIQAEDTGDYNITCKHWQLEGIKVHFEGFKQAYENGTFFKVSLIEMDAQSSLYFDSGIYRFGEYHSDSPVTVYTKIYGQRENDTSSQVYFFQNGGEGNQTNPVDIEDASVFLLGKGATVGDLINCNVEMNFASSHSDDASINSINNTVPGLTVSIGAGTVKFAGLTANGGEVNISGGFVTNITTENCEVTVSGGTFSNQFHSTEDNLLIVDGAFGSADINNTGTTGCSALVKGGIFQNGFSVDGEGVKVSGGTYYNKPDIADNIPAGYEWIQTSDISTGRQVWTLICHAYKVGEMKYSTLEDAVEGCGTSGTITVLADIEDIGAQIPADAEITLDLNGCSPSSDAGAVSVSDGAQLTVTDSVGSGVLGMEIVSTSTSSKLIVNSGELTKTVDFGGRVEISDGTFAGEIHASNGAKISGGTFAGEVHASNGAYIYDGTFNDAFTADSANELSNELIIIDGTFNGTVTLRSQYHAPEITGGTFNGTFGSDSGCKLPLATGGKFRNVENLSFKEGYIPTLDEDGYYQVMPIGAKSYYANGKLYDDLQSALNDCDSGKENVIELLKNTEEENPILDKPNVNVTLKLKGYTMTVTDAFLISADSDITIIGDGILKENGDFTANGAIVGKLSVNGTAVLTNVKVESVVCDAGSVTLNDSGVEDLLFHSGTLIVNGARISGYNHSSVDAKPVFGDGTIYIINLTVSSGALDINKDNIHVLYPEVSKDAELSISAGTIKGLLINDGTLNTSGGTFDGEIRGSGVFNINDGTFNNTILGDTITVSGGTFEKYVKADGKLTVRGGSFKNTVESKNGLDISGGTFNGKVTAESESSGVNEITISGGTFNGNVSFRSRNIAPEISGGTFNAEVGVTELVELFKKPVASGGSFKNIDGITAADGHVFIKNGEYYVVDSAEKYPFRVNGAVYQTLAAAVEACGAESDTIELLFNAQVNDDVTVNDKQITIELNGLTLTIAPYIFLTVGKTSTLQINGGQEKGTVDGRITNNGTFRAQSVALDRLTAEGSTSINACTANTIDLCADAGLELVNSEVTILCQESSTELRLEDADNIIDCLLGKTGNISITNGKINDLETSKICTGTISISGGTFEGTIKKVGGTITATGGRFKNDPTDNVTLPKGYGLVEKDSYYVVEKMQVVKVGAEIFSTLGEALEFVRTQVFGDAEIEVLRDFVLDDESYTIENRTITLDLGSHTISGTADFIVDGVFTVKNGTLGIELPAGAQAATITVNNELVLQDSLIVSNAYSVKAVNGLVTCAAEITDLQVGEAAKATVTGKVTNIDNSGKLFIRDGAEIGTLINTAGTTEISGGTITGSITNTSGTISASGGKFVNDPTDKVTIARGCTLTQRDGYYWVEKAQNLKCGDEYFATLDEAFEYAGQVNGEAEIVVLQNFDLDADVTLDQMVWVSLDLGGFTIGGNKNLNINGMLTVKNGQIGTELLDGAAQVYIHVDGTLKLEKDVVISEAYYIDVALAADLYSAANVQSIRGVNGSSITVTDGTIESIDSNGNIMLYGGNINKVSNSNMLLIAGATVGTVVNFSFARIDSGTITTFSNTNSTSGNKVTANFVGGTVTTLDNQSSVSITGGTFESIVNEEVADLRISGGTVGTADSDGTAITNNGTLTVENGTIGNTVNAGTMTVKNGTAANITNSGTLTVENGTIANITNDGTLNINGGTVSFVNNSVVHVTDGKILRAEFGSGTADSTISRGTFEKSVFNNTPEQLYVTGGSFKDDPTGEVKIDDKNEFFLFMDYYVLRVHPTIRVEHGNEVFFASGLNAAFTQMTEDGSYVLKLLEDIEETQSVSVKSGQEVELVFNANKITGIEGLISVESGAKLILSDSAQIEGEGGDYPIKVSGEIELESNALKGFGIELRSDGKFTAKEGNDFEIDAPEYALKAAEGAVLSIHDGTFLGQGLSATGKHDITGGVFANDITALITDDTYACVKMQSQLYKVAKAPIIVVSNGIESRYENLSDAFYAVHDGDTVKLRQDYSVGYDDMVAYASGSCTFDLNGKTLSGSPRIFGDGITITVKNGTADGIAGYGASIEAENLTVHNTLEVVGAMGGNTCSLNIASGNYGSVNAGVGTTAVISGGTIGTLSCTGEVTMSGGEVTKDAALWNATVTGGTFRGNVELDGGGLISNGLFYGSLSVGVTNTTRIQGGEYYFEKSYDWTAVRSCFPDQYYPEYIEAAGGKAAHWEIKENKSASVVKITHSDGTSKHSNNFEMAMLDLQAGDTVELLTTVKYSQPLTVPVNNVTFDFNGYSLGYMGSGDAITVYENVTGVKFRNGSLNLSGSNTRSGVCLQSAAEASFNCSISGGSYAVYNDGGHISMPRGNYRGSINAVYTKNGTLTTGSGSNSAEPAALPSVISLEAFLTTSAYEDACDFADLSTLSYMPIEPGDTEMDKERVEEVSEQYSKYLRRVVSSYRSANIDSAAVTLSGNGGDALVIDGGSATVERTYLRGSVSTNIAMSFTHTDISGGITLNSSGKTISITNCTLSDYLPIMSDASSAQSSSKAMSAMEYSEGHGMTLLAASPEDINSLYSCMNINGDDNIINFIRSQLSGSNSVYYNGNNNKVTFDHSNFAGDGKATFIKNHGESNAFEAPEGSGSNAAGITQLFASSGKLVLTFVGGLVAKELGGKAAITFGGAILTVVAITGISILVSLIINGKKIKPVPKPTEKPTPTATPKPTEKPDEGHCYKVGVDKYYDDGELQFAIEEAQGTGETITMLRSNKLQEPSAIVTGDVNLLLGKNVLSLGTSISTSGNLTIDGGTITSQADAITATGGKLNVNGTTIQAAVKITGGEATFNSAECSKAVTVSGAQKVTLLNGTYTGGVTVSTAKMEINGASLTTEQMPALTLNTEADVTILGGTFKGGEGTGCIMQNISSLLRILDGTFTGDLKGSGLSAPLKAEFFRDILHPSGIFVGNTLIAGGTFNKSNVSGLIMDATSVRNMPKATADMLDYAFVSKLLNGGQVNIDTEAEADAPAEAQVYALRVASPVTFNKGKFTGFVLGGSVQCNDNSFGKGTYALLGMMSGAFDGVPPLFFLPSTLELGKIDHDYIDWNVLSQKLNRVSGIAPLIVDAAFSAAANISFSTPKPTPKPYFEFLPALTPQQIYTWLLSYIETITRSHVYYLAVGPAQVDESFKIIMTMKQYDTDEKLKSEDKASSNAMLDEVKKVVKDQAIDESKAIELINTLVAQFGDSAISELDSPYKSFYGITAGGYEDSIPQKHICDVCTFGVGYAKDKGMSFTLVADKMLSDGSEFVRFEDTDGKPVGEAKYDPVKELYYLTLTAKSKSQKLHYVAAYQDKGYVAAIVEEGAETVRYTSFGDAFAAIRGEGETLMLLKDCTLPETACVLDGENKLLTIDLAGRTLSNAPTDNSYLMAKNGAKLTFTDSGSTKGTFKAVKSEADGAGKLLGRLRSEAGGILDTRINIDASDVNTAVHFGSGGKWIVVEGQSFKVKSGTSNHNTEESSVTSIASGEFDKEIYDSDCAPEYAPKALEDGWWTVEKQTVVAVIIRDGEEVERCISFAAAAAKIVSGDTVKLLENCSLPESGTNFYNVTVTIDFNGHELSTKDTINSSLYAGSGTKLIFVDSSTGKNGGFRAVAYAAGKYGTDSRLMIGDNAELELSANIFASGVEYAVSLGDGGKWIVPEGTDITVRSDTANYNRSTKGTVSIASGKFNKQVYASDCATGYQPKNLGNGWWTVEKKTYTLALYSRLVNGGNYSVAKISGGGIKQYDEQVTIVAENAANMTFDGWYYCTVEDEETHKVSFGELFSREQTLTFNMPAKDVTLAAVYRWTNSKTANLTVSWLGDEAKENMLKVNGVLQKSDHATYTVPLGSLVVLECLDTDNFRFWTNGLGSDKIISGSSLYIFPMASNSRLVADCYRSDQESYANVEFISAFNQIMGSFKVQTTDDPSGMSPMPPLPSKLGYIDGIWSINGESREQWLSVTWTEIIDYIKQHPDEHYLQVRSIYRPDPSNCAIEIFENSEEPSRTLVYPKGTSFTVTAKDFEGTSFMYWCDENDHILSYNKSLYICASQNRQLYAVYGDTPVTVKPVMNITSIYVTSGTEEESAKISFEATRSVPEGYEVLEHGMIWTTNADTGTDEKLIVDGPGVSKMKASTTTLDGVFTANLRVGSAAAKAKMIYARGYMVLLNTTSGEMSVVYSPIVNDSYNSVVN